MLSAQVPDELDQRFIFAVAAGEQRLAEIDRGIDLDDRAVVDRQSPRRAEKQLAVLGDVAELTHPVEQLGQTWSGIAGADEEEPAELIEDFQFRGPLLIVLDAGDEVERCSQLLFGLPVGDVGDGPPRCRSAASMASSIGAIGTA